jgi:hypothetical protein
MSSRLTRLAAAVLTGVVAAQAHAVLIVNEQFLTGSNPAAGEYNTTLRLNNQSPVPTVQGLAASGWVSGAGTGQTHVVEGTLNVGGVGYEAGGKVQFDGSTVDALYRSNARAITTPYATASANGPVFVSGLVATDAFPDTPANVGQRGYALMGLTNAQAANATTNALLGYYFGFRANANDSLDLILRHRNGTNTTVNPFEDVVLVPGASAGTAYHVLIRADVNTVGGNQEPVRWWVNPADVTDEATATASALATGTFTDFSIGNPASDISRLTVATFRWDANSYYDEFRLGTTFADVAGPFVPEPASLGLLAAAGTLLARRRQ